MSKFISTISIVLIVLAFVTIHLDVNAQTTTSSSSTTSTASSATTTSSTSTTTSTLPPTSSSSSTSSVISESSSSEVIIEESSSSVVSQVPIDVIDLKKVYPPRNVSAELVFDSEKNTYSIELTWEPSKTEGIEKLIIMRSEGNRLKFTELAEVGASDTKYVDKDFKTDTTYYYTIQAVKEDEISRDSNEAIVQITKETQLEAQQVQRESKDNFWMIFLIVNVLVWSIIFIGFVIVKIVQKIRNRKKSAKNSLTPKNDKEVKKPESFRMRVNNLQ